MRLAAATGASSNGRLLRTPRAVGASRFRSDPSRPLADLFNGAAGAHDYRSLVDRRDLLVFETGPLVGPLEIIGNVIAELEVSATVPDFDVWLQLYDVSPDGTAWNLSSFGTALQRASYGDGGPDRKVVKPGSHVTLRMNRMVTANRFLPGHRIRVTLSGAFVPWFSRNLQTGALEFDSTRTGAGTITVHHPASRLILPVVAVSP
jgi:putative CocE/NonD family hydrolase